MPELEGWLQAIDADEKLESSQPGERARVILRSLRGLPRELGEEWLRSAALVHIVGWRLDNYATSEVHPDDLILPGGEEATRWVYERFTETYPEDWSPGSLNWEATFRMYPGEVASHVGLPLALLEGRTVTEAQLGRARLESILNSDDAPEVDGMSLAEIVDIALAQLDKGYQEGAVQLAGRAVRTAPRNPMVRALHAFCLLPSSPNTSRQIWLDMLDDPDGDGRGPLDPDILRADIATAYLMLGDAENAERVVGELRRAEGRDETTAWLWDPLTLPERPAVIHCTLGDWLDRFRTRYPSR